MVCCAFSRCCLTTGVLPITRFNLFNNFFRVSGLPLIFLKKNLPSKNTPTISPLYLFYDMQLFQLYMFFY